MKRLALLISTFCVLILSHTSVLAQLDTVNTDWSGQVLYHRTDSSFVEGSHSGIPEHVTFTCQVVGNTIEVGETIELIFKPHLVHHSTIMYSSDSLCAYGPQFAHLEFKDSACTRVGPLRSYNTIRHSDEIFLCDYKYFEDDGEMRQRLTIVDMSQPMDMTLEYQLCNDVQGFCLNREYHVQIDWNDMR